MDQDSAQTHPAEKLDVTQQAISKKLHALSEIQKGGEWVPYELTTEQREKRIDTCFSLLSRQKRKAFCGNL